MLKRLRPTITLPLSHLACESSLTLAKCHGLRVLAFVCLMHSHTGPLLNWLTDALPRAHRYHPDLGYVGDGPPESEAEAEVFARRAHNPEQVNATCGLRCLYMSLRGIDLRHARYTMMQEIASRSPLASSHPRKTPRSLTAATDFAASVADAVKADATGEAARERTQNLTLQAAMTANGQLLNHLKNAIVSLDSVGESSASDARDYEYASTLARVQADLRFALSHRKKLEEMALAAAATAGAARETAAEFSAQVIDAGIAEAEAMVLEAARTCSSTRIISSSSSLSRVFSEATRSSSRASC